MLANSEDCDQTPHDVASNLCLQFLLLFHTETARLIGTNTYANKT